MDLLEQCELILKPSIEKYFAIDKSGHDLEHLKRVKNNALFLQSKEGGDKLVIALSALLHDEETPLFYDTYSEQKNANETTIQHIYNKLLRLPENMNTKTAKIVATNRNKILKDFVNQFIDEWKGNFEV